MKSTLKDRMHEQALDFVKQELAKKLNAPSRKVCEDRIAQFKGRNLCQQAYEYYSQWLNWWKNEASAPNMLPASSLEED